MVDFAVSAALAKRLIEANGRDITLVKPGATTLRDVTKPWLGYDNPLNSGEEVTATVKGVFSNEDANVRYGDQSGSDETFANSKIDRYFLVAATSTALAGQDIREFQYVRDGTNRFRITNISVLKPGDTDILYYIGVEQ